MDGWESNKIYMQKPYHRLGETATLKAAILESYASLKAAVRLIILWWLLMRYCTSLVKYSRLRSILVLVGLQTLGRSKAKKELEEWKPLLHPPSHYSCRTWAAGQSAYRWDRTWAAGQSAYRWDLLRLNALSWVPFKRQIGKLLKVNPKLAFVLA